MNEYELFLAQINSLMDRRQTVTTTYLSVTTAIIGAVAFLFKDGQLSNWPQQTSVLILLLSGIIACTLWRALITQYSTLLGWWYQQLRILEEVIPNSSQLITKEYQELYLKKHNRAPIGLTRYETQLTWLFTTIYVVFGCAILILLLKNISF